MIIELIIEMIIELRHSNTGSSQWLNKGQPLGTEGGLGDRQVRVPVPMDTQVQKLFLSDLSISRTGRNYGYNCLILSSFQFYVKRSTLQRVQ